MLPLSLRSTVTALAVLLLAAPAGAAQRSDASRAQAGATLERVEDLLDGQGVRTGRELSGALLELSRVKDDLSATDERRAVRILRRPTDAGDDDAYTAPVGDRRSYCRPAGDFCLHWVISGDDAPDLTDTNPSPNGRPDYVDFMESAFEQSYAVEVTQLGWDGPLSDADEPNNGGNGLLDVYIANIGNQAYGYAAPEDDARSSSGYLVLDNDYSDAEFDEYDGEFTIPVQATAAHEFNHILQYRYDALQDRWMFESTATWSEDKVFDDANDYLFYLGPWARRPGQSLTDPGTDPATDEDGLKMYGSAIWNHWLEARHGPEVVRQAWDMSDLPANTVQSGGFAPGAYNAAIVAEGGPGFAAELQEFLTSAAEWDASNSGIPEGDQFPEEVARSGTLNLDATPATGALDHAASALYTVPATSAASVTLTGGLPAGVSGAIALVGYDQATDTLAKALVPMDGDGRVTATLADPGRFERITAVVVNSDTSHGPFVGGEVQDWTWTRDDQPFSLAANDGRPTVTPTPTPTAGPTATPTATPTVTPTPPRATSVALSRVTSKLRTVARTGVLPIYMRPNRGGRGIATGSTDRATSRRLRVGRRSTRVGIGRRTATANQRVKLNVRLTRKARNALRRERGRTLRITVRVTFLPADGTVAITRSLPILLRP